MIDLHCHIAPGLDDGPRDVEESRRLARALKQLGFSQVATTPHLPWGSFFVDVAKLRRRLEEGISALSGDEFPRLVMGAEHHSDLLPELLEQNELVCYPGGGCFLMEFPLSGFPPRLSDLLFRIQVKKLRAVIAHVERYPQVQRDIGCLEQFIEKGFYLLVNLGSLAGEWDREAARTARQVIKAGLCHALTSDLHMEEQLEGLARGLQLARELVDEGTFVRLTESGPSEILARGPGR